MIRQYRIDRYNGLEFLVCEVYFKHTWTQSESDAYTRYVEEMGASYQAFTRSDFRTVCNEWFDEEHPSGETFYGLSEPIPAIETIPQIVVRGAIINNRVASLAADYVGGVTSLEVIDTIQKFFDFMKSPHWRNTVLSQISNYGSLFGSDND